MNCHTKRQWFVMIRHYNSGKLQQASEMMRLITVDRQFVPNTKGQVGKFDCRRVFLLISERIIACKRLVTIDITMKRNIYVECPSRNVQKLVICRDAQNLDATVNGIGSIYYIYLCQSKYIINIAQYFLM